MLFISRRLAAWGQSSCSNKRERLELDIKEGISEAVLHLRQPRGISLCISDQRNILELYKRSKTIKIYWRSLQEKNIFSRIRRSELNLKKEKKMGSGGSRLEPSLEIKTYPKFEAVTCSAQGWRPSRYRRIIGPIYRGSHIISISRSKFVDVRLQLADVESKMAGWLRQNGRYRSKMTDFLMVMADFK